MKYIKEYIDFEEDWEEYDNYLIIKNIDEDFYDFLVKNNIIDQYIDNIKDIEKLNYRFDNTYIGIFDWRDSKEGYDFWKDIDYDWRLNCKIRKNKKEKAVRLRKRLMKFYGIPEKRP